MNRNDTWERRHRVVKYLATRGAARTADVASLLQVEHHTAIACLKAMAALGLIACERRVVAVSTFTGRAHKQRICFWSATDMVQEHQERCERKCKP